MRLPSNAHRVVFASAAGLALVGAGGAVKVGAKDSPTATPAAVHSPVTVLDAGREPRLLMRLGASVGFEQRTTQRQEQTIQITVGGQTINASPPPFELDVRTRIDSVANHRIRTTTTYDAARVLNAPGTTPDVKATMTKMAQSMVGQSVKCVRTDAAVLLRCSHFHITFPDAIKQAGDAFAKGLENDQPSLAMPFPDAPVGVGARWTFSPKANAFGIKTKPLTEVTITRISGRRIDAAIKQTIKFLPGTTKVGEVTATVESGDLSGTGTVAWNLDRIDPLIETTIEGSTVMTASSGNDRQRVEQFQHQSFRVVERGP